MKMRLVALVFTIIPFLISAQHEPISQLPGNQFSGPYRIEAYGHGKYLVMPGRFSTSVVNTETGDWEIIETGVQDVAEVNGELLYLSRNGLVRFENGDFTPLESIGSYDFVYTNLIASRGDKAFFTEEKNQIWQTDGTETGTFFLDTLERDISFLLPIGDTLHVISQGETTTHFAININTLETVTNVLPDNLRSLRLYPNEQLQFRGYYEEGVAFYSLTSRTISHIPSFPLGASFKSLNDSHYCLRWIVDVMDREGTLQIFNVDFQANISELIYSGNESSFMRGVVDLYPLEGEDLLLMGATKNYGSEVYRFDNSHNADLLKDIYPGPQSGLYHPVYSSSGSQLQYLEKYDQAISYEGVVYFSALSPEEGLELWRSDGTAEGTYRISNFYPGSAGAEWITPFVVDGLLYATLFDGEKLVIYKIDTAFSPLQEGEEDESDDEWDRFFFRDGGGYEYRHAPQKEPVIISQEDGIIGLIQGFRFTDLNNRDKWISEKGDLNYEIPYLGFDTHLNFLYWLDNAGNLKNSEWILAHGDQCVMASPDGSKEVFVSYYHKDESRIGDDEIRSDGLGWVLAKIDRDGEVVWQKLFNKDRGIQVHEIDASANYIVASGYYWGEELILAHDITIQSAYSPQYFTAAFDHDGNPIWAVNTSMEGLERHSTLGQIVVDEGSGRVYTTSSEHSLNTWNSCEDGSWVGRVTAHNLNSGEVLWTKDFLANDKFRIRDIELDSRGNIWVGGNFRGEVNYSGKHSFSARGSSCPSNPFIAVISGASGAMVNTVLDYDENMFFQKFMAREAFMDALYLGKSDAPEFDLAPYSDRKMVVIHKATYQLSGYKVSHNVYPTRRSTLAVWDNIESYKIAGADQGESFIIKLFTEIGQPGLYDSKAFPFRHTRSPVSVSRRPHTKEVSPENFEHPEFSDSGFLIYPNPITDRRLTIVLEADQLSNFHEMEIRDMQGRLIFKSALMKRHYSMVYFLPVMDAGAYSVILHGNEASASQLLIVGE